MASTYVDAIKRVQPRGPYYLAGYCLGGSVALEMAQLLKRDGQNVALLAMFESYNLASANGSRGRLTSFRTTMQTDIDGVALRTSR